MAVGFGVNNFSMNRGSFKYDHKIVWHSDCVLTDTQEIDNNLILTFKDKKYSTVHKITINTDGTKKTLNHERIDDLDVKLIAIINI